MCITFIRLSSLFSTFKDDQFIIRMADPKGLLKYEGLSARETLGKLLSGGFNESPEMVLKELDDRLNAAFGALDPEVQASYIAQEGWITMLKPGNWPTFRLTRRTAFFYPSFAS